MFIWIDANIHQPVPEIKFTTLYWNSPPLLHRRDAIRDNFSPIRYVAFRLICEMSNGLLRIWNPEYTNAPTYDMIWYVPYCISLCHQSSIAHFGPPGAFCLIYHALKRHRTQIGVLKETLVQHPGTFSTDTCLNRTQYFKEHVFIQTLILATSR